jgi:type II secretory pathway pseudopilin PulG
MKMKIKKGFSLLELTLVLGVGTIVAFMKFQDMKNEQESILASAVGQQMKQIGEAVNGYINIRYDKLSTLSNAAGTGTDPGPRTCSGSVCEITYQTLINEGLLPSTYTGTNANKSSYKIILKRDGTSPNYVINGLITTSTAWIEGGKTRYDLLGKAMQTAGIDSGMTRTTSNAFGYGGQWSETSANFNNITSAGQLAFRVGFNSALYSVYLRRDGTLPMTGDLNYGWY